MRNIINFKKLAQNSLRRKALLIAEAGYEAIEIEKVIKKRIKLRSNKLKIVHSYILENVGINKNLEKNAVNAELDRLGMEIDLNNFKRIFVIGIGKGSALASATLAKILGKRLNKCIALDINKPHLNSKFLILNSKFFIGTHPLPSKQNIKATQEIIKLAKSLNEKDLLITFICGGGSALACASKAELKNTTSAIKELTKAGAAISELNTVRKHFSDFKGGNLAKMACPAKVVSLIVSDVCGNDLSNVASGPTVLDKTTKKDAEKILNKYLRKSMLIRALKETPKDVGCFKNVKNILFVCNQDAIAGTITKIEKLELKARIYSLALEGEARTAFLPMIKNIKFGEAIIAAGETTVTLKNKKSGKGGRNQEAVLGAINIFANQSQIKFANIREKINNGLENIIIISFTSDGHDNTKAAGVIGDFLTLEKAKKLKLNPQKYLNNHDSFNFFKKIGDLIYAEQKCFNVADLMLVLSLPKD